MLKMFHTKNILEAGVDEAGRGPLFGRVYIAAVILPQDEKLNHKLIKDSKKLSERNRLLAYDYVKEIAIDYNVFYYDEKKIDEINIFKATYLGMHKAIDGLSVRPDHLLIDGTYFNPYYFENRVIPYSCIEKGDNVYCSIAAASILAKVERDKYINELCKDNSVLDKHYGLKSNKGYGTVKHIEGIKKYGISPYHRKTFGICKNY